MARVIDADLDMIYTEQEFPLGTLTEPDAQNRTFIFLKYNDGDGDVDAVEGYLGVQTDTGLPVHEVTCDYTEGGTVTIIPLLPRGFAQAAFTNGTYGWWQIYGPNRKDMKTDEGVAQGQRLMKSANQALDGEVDSWATGSAQIAVALEADGTTTADILDPGQAFITIAQ